MENIFNESQRNPERVERDFFFEIKHKHPKSEKLYRLRADMDNLDNFTNELHEARKDNPFKHLDGEVLKFNGEEIGKIESKNDLSPRCLYDSEGHPDCGFFFEVNAEVTTSKLTKEEVRKLVLDRISEQGKVDYINELNE
jgi:hypothetical protein